VVDVLTVEQRRRCMARVRNKDTAPELIVRRAIRALGFRYRLHRKELPGSPDIVILKHKVAVFVHGCFWHGHARCKRGKRPTSNLAFWNKKLDANLMRDRLARKELRKMHWRVMIIWECHTHDGGLQHRLASVLGRSK
jgi:DNA mismatch endonuclease (patch repair protein)